MLTQIRLRIRNKKGFLHNISILFVCNIMVNIIGLFINMFLARKLQPEGYGEYGLVLSWSSILLVVSSLGIQQVAIRSIAQNQDKSGFYFKVSFIARMLGYIITAILFILYYRNFIEKSNFILLIILSQTLVLTAWDGIQNLAFGMQRMEYTGYINVFGQIILISLYVILPKSAINITVILILLVTIGALKDIAYYYKCRKEKLFVNSLSDYNKISKNNIYGIIKESFPFYVLAVFTLFTTQFPVLFLERNAGLSEVAYFNTANKLMVPMTTMLNTIMVALFPNLAKDAADNPSVFIEKVKKIITTIIPFAIFICCIIAMFRDEIVYILFGSSYRNTGMVMSTQCWYIVMNFLFSLFGTVWAATKHDNLLSSLSILYACVNTPILWITSKYGASAMSCGYIIGAFINMTYHYWFFLKTLGHKINAAFSIKLFLLLCFGIAFSFIFPINISLLYRFIVSVILAIITAVYLRNKLKATIV